MTVHPAGLRLCVGTQCSSCSVYSKKSLCACNSVCVCVCKFLSKIWMPLCLLQGLHVYCTVYIQVSPQHESVCWCRHVCVLVWLGSAPAVSEWAAPNASTPRRGRKGGVKGRASLSLKWEMVGLTYRSRWRERMANNCRNIGSYYNDDKSIRIPLVIQFVG